MTKKYDTLDNFKRTYSYRSLLEKHSLDEEGMWEIRGEDENCDLGGAHYMPRLGIVEGKLQDVINYAVALPRFWTWGAGGEITKISAPVKISAESTAKRLAAETKVKELESLLEEACKELKGL